MERRIEEINRFTVGWTAYFALADTPWPFEKLDKWLAQATAAGALEGMEAPSHASGATCVALGIPERDARKWACSRKGYWRIAGSRSSTAPCPTPTGHDHGLKGFLDPYRRFRDAERTAGCGPARPVVWEGAGVSPAPTRSQAKAAVRWSVRPADAAVANGAN